MRELALHILDLAENSISAGANNISIGIEENLQADVLKINITDDGKGMDQETLAKITDPFITSRTTRNVGLGIPFFKAAAEACEGTFEIQSQPKIGTQVKVTFKHSHIDRMPIGSITDTMLALVIGSPEVNWYFEYRVDDQTFTFDDRPIKETLDGIPLSEPAVMKFIRQTLEEGVNNLQKCEQLII